VKNMILTSLLGICILMLVLLMADLKQSWELWSYDWGNHAMLSLLVILDASMIVILAGNMITDNFPIKIVMSISGTNIVLIILPLLTFILLSLERRS